MEFIYTFFKSTNRSTFNTPHNMKTRILRTKLQVYNQIFDKINKILRTCIKAVISSVLFIVWSNNIT